MRISDWSSDVCSSDLPVRVIAQMIGIPLEDEPKFTGWAVRTLQEGLQNLADLPEVFEEMTAYFVQHVAERRAMAEGSRPDDIRSEGGRVGKECVRTGRSRWSPDT